MKKIKKVVAAVLVFVGMLMPVIATTADTYAAVSCPPGSVRSSAPTATECNVEVTSKSIWDVAAQVINVVLAVLGVATVIVIIIGGVNYVLSQGDPAKVKRAKDTIMYGVIGLIIALLAYAIVNFVLAGVFGS
ncbi:hypothetical protein IJH97_01185 [Candidatus Saccharibacteria bacterium]|nr:hypothetical protein [Candidatus Saccharibacteria bacterium]